MKKFVGFKKKYYFCAMKSIVDISLFSSGKRLEMRMFDGLRGGVRLAGQTVDSYGYGRKLAYIYTLGVCGGQCSRTSKAKHENHENTKIYLWKFLNK